MSGSGFVLGFNNYITQGYGSWTLDPSKFPGTEDVADVMLDPRVAVASVLASATAIDFVRRFSASDVSVGLISLMNHSIVQGGTVTITLYDSSDSVVQTIAIDTTTDPRWFEPPSTKFQRTLNIILDSTVQASAIGVTYTGGFVGNTAQIGHLWVSDTFRTEDGVTENWSTGVVDTGSTKSSREKQTFVRTGSRTRWFKGTLVTIDFETAFGERDDGYIDLQWLLYEVGTTSPVVMFPRTLSSNVADYTAINRLHVYGSFQELGAIKHGGGNNFMWEDWTVDSWN